jgi:hypothetical protein
MRPLFHLTTAFAATILTLGLALYSIMVFALGNISSDAEGSALIEMTFGAIIFGSLALFSTLALAGILALVPRALIDWNRRAAIATGTLFGGVAVFASATGFVHAFDGRLGWLVSSSLPGVAAAVLVIAIDARRGLARAYPPNA